MKTNSKKWSSEKISRTFQMVGTVIIAVVFLLYYLVGYNVPAPWDEKYNSPVLTDLVIILMGVLFVAAIAVVCLSNLHSLRTNHSPEVVNNVPGKRIKWGVIAATVIMLAVTGLALPVDRILKNGEIYDDAFWLHVANMFVISSTLLIIIGVAAIAFFLLKNRRKK